MGRMVPELGSVHFRERFVHKYRLIYRVETENILIVAVIHGSRLLEPIIGRTEGV
jgi:toxin ParE1/3/4